MPSNDKLSRPVACLECGTPFVRTSSKQGFCSQDCRLERQRRQGREYIARQRVANSPVYARSKARARAQKQAQKARPLTDEQRARTRAYFADWNARRKAQYQTAQKATHAALTLARSLLSAAAAGEQLDQRDIDAALAAIDAALGCIPQSRGVEG